MGNTPHKRNTQQHTAVISWNKERGAFLCVAGGKTTEIAASPELKKHEGMRTPEELFVETAACAVRDAFCFKQPARPCKKINWSG